VPLSPQVMTRALLIPWAHRLALKPAGSLILSTGISPGALGAGGWATGANGEFASSAGWPCFQGGGAAGCCAWAGISHDVTAASTNTLNVITNMRRM
jgi:hypothetical protein